MTEKKSLLDPEKVKNEPDFFNFEARKEGSVCIVGEELIDDADIASMEQIIDRIKTVIDPEIPVNLYDLGLIYNIDIDEKGNIEILMTLTAPNCPVAGEIPTWVGNAINDLDNVGVIMVKLTWTPPWKKEMMSEDAKMALDIY